MNLMPPSTTDNQHGFAMVQVLVAMAILGILVVVFSGLVTQTLKAQKIARIQGEKISLQTIFRGSVTCETSCRDLKRDIPQQIGRWSVKPVCSSKKLVLNVAHPDLYAGKWNRLYKEGSEKSVCKNVSQISGPRLPSGVERRRISCPDGKRVSHVNFTNQTIGCR